MKRLLSWSTLAVICAISSPPAAAYLENVSAPISVETGTPFLVSIQGFLPDPCWELQGYEWTASAQVLTIDIHTAYWAPPGSGCPQVLIPFEVDADVTLNDPGNWLLRVVEHRQHPVYQFPDLVREQTITATGSVAVESVAWGALRARYR